MRIRLKNIHIEEWVALSIGIGASVLNSAVFKSNLSFKDTLLYMARYFTFGDPFFAFFIVFIYVFYLFLLYRSFVIAVIGKVLYKKPFPRVRKNDILRSLLLPFRIVSPLVVAGLPISILLGNFNNWLRFSVKDVSLFRFDMALFGTSPFIWLANTFSSPFFTALFKYAYFSLSLVMSATLGFLFLFSQKTNALIFRQALLSFITSLIFSVPLFYAIPCNDPSNYAVGHTGLPEDLKKVLAVYHPSAITKEIMKKITDAETYNGKYSPSISCFPSMHATWSLLSLYFLYSVAPWTLFFTIPWITFLLTGGLYFAQHYFVDYFVAIPVVIASILSAKALLTWEKKRRTVLRTVN